MLETPIFVFHRILDLKKVRILSGPFLFSYPTTLPLLCFAQGFGKGSRKRASFNGLCRLFNVIGETDKLYIYGFLFSCAAVFDYVKQDITAPWITVFRLPH